MARLGFPAIRGSSAKKSDPAKAKGGAAGLPRGAELAARRRRAGDHAGRPARAGRGDGRGPPQLAGMSGAPVLLVGIACQPCLRLDSWDRAVVAPALRPRRHRLGRAARASTRGTSRPTLAAAAARPGAERLSAATAAGRGGAAHERRRSPLYRAGDRRCWSRSRRLLLRGARRRGKEDPAPPRRAARAAPRPRGRRGRWSGCTAPASARACRSCRWSRRCGRERPDAAACWSPPAPSPRPSCWPGGCRAGVIHQYAPVDTPRRRAPLPRPLAARPRRVRRERAVAQPAAAAPGARRAAGAGVGAAVARSSLGGWAGRRARRARLLGAFDLVMPQDDATAARLGAPRRPRRRPAEPEAGRASRCPADAAALARACDAALGGRPVLLAA